MRLTLLLRAVNLGRSNKVPMRELATLLAELGHRDVRTYIASGNALVTTDREPLACESELEAALLERFGLATVVMARTAGQLRAAVEALPFPTTPPIPPTSLAVCFLKTAPPAGAPLRVEVDDDVAQVVDREAYLWARGGFGRTKLTPDLVARRLGVQGTARNWRTTTTLAELASQVAP